MMFWTTKYNCQAGRPAKCFEESSIRSKRRKTQNIRENLQTEELAFATQLKLREAGKAVASKVLNEIFQSPGRAQKYRKTYCNSLKEKREKMSTLRALSMFVEAGLSRKQYEIIATSDKSLFPCYSLLQKAKKIATLPRSHTM